MSDDTEPKGETEAEYYARIAAVPGSFSDKLESGHTVVHKAKILLREAEQLFERSTLAPNPHNEETETQPEQATPEPTPDPVADPEPSSESEPKEENAVAPVLASGDDGFVEGPQPGNVNPDDQTVVETETPVEISGENSPDDTKVKKSTKKS